MAEMKIFSGTNSRYVALKIAKELGMELGNLNIMHFADGEFEVCYEEPVRGAEVYLVQQIVFAEIKEYFGRVNVVFTVVNRLFNLLRCQRSVDVKRDGALGNIHTQVRLD